MQSNGISSSRRAGNNAHSLGGGSNGAGTAEYSAGADGAGHPAAGGGGCLLPFAGTDRAQLRVSGAASGPRGADAQSLQAVSDISAATAKLERTINELLSALEFLRAGQPPKLYPLDLCELLQQVAAQADMVRAQLGVTLELDYGGWTACRVLADRDDVELLCLHLLSNALRACREGGTVRILLRRSETMWQLTVRDNGCGLPEGSQEAWLENRRSFLGGAQLGLLLCRECCRRMGWGLSVECAPEKGTQAVVTVPLYTDDGRAPEVELHAGADLASEQHQYQLRAMLVRELRTMPERGDPDE